VTRCTIGGRDGGNSLSRGRPGIWPRFNLLRLVSQPPTDTDDWNDQEHDQSRTRALIAAQCDGGRERRDDQRNGQRVPKHRHGSLAYAVLFDDTRWQRVLHAKLPTGRRIATEARINLFRGASGPPSLQPSSRSSSILPGPRRRSSARMSAAPWPGTWLL